MNIRVLLILLVVLFSSICSNAQVITDSVKVNNDTIVALIDPVYSPKNQELNLVYNYDFASYLNNAFLKAYYSSGYIDNELKDENLKRLNGENNPLGLCSDLIIQYRNQPGLLFGSSSLGFSAALEWHSINEMLFTDDFFSLMFYGNKQFAGKEAANLHNTSTNMLNYYQIKGGLFKKDDFRDIEYGFQLALNLGNQYSNFSSKNTSLFVDTLGKFIDFSGVLSYESTSTTNSNYSKIQGYGISTDFYFLKNVLYDYQLRIDIRNIGFILWNEDTQVFNNEEKIHFEGIEVENIFSNSISTNNTSLLDSITEYINDGSEYRKLNMFTPSDISIYYMKYVNKKVSLFGQLKYRILSFQDIYFSLGSDYHFNKNICLGGIINYGSYSKFNVGLNFQVKIKTNFAIELQSRYLTGVIYNSFSGIGAFLQLNYKF